MSDIADKSAQFEALFIQEGLAKAVTKSDQPQEMDGDTVICSCCGDPIPPERLKVLPKAALCVECKSLLEKS